MPGKRLEECVLLHVEDDDGSHIFSGWPCGIAASVRRYFT